MKPVAALLALALLATVLSPPGVAASKRTERAAELERSLELTMVVSGDIDVDADGQVLRYTFDHRKQLPAALVELLDGRVPLWRFAPKALPAGQTHSALRMRLRVFANRIGDAPDMYRISLRDAAFFLREDPRPKSDRLIFDRRSRIQAPDDMSGVVYLALRIGADGTVLQSFVERVDLVVPGSAEDMALRRESLARFTERQAKRIRFWVPTTGPDAGLGEWQGRLPLAYNTIRPVPWEWNAYFRGPETRAPWKPAEDAENEVPADLLPTDTVETLQQARLLLSPLDVD